jgi:hypothetical protein
MPREYRPARIRLDTDLTPAAWVIEVQDRAGNWNRETWVVPDKEDPRRFVVSMQGRSADGCLWPKGASLLEGLGIIIVNERSLPEQELFEVAMAPFVERLPLCRNEVDVALLVMEYEHNLYLFDKARKVQRGR